MSQIEIHFDKQINNLRVVREPDARYRSEYMLLSLLGVLFVLGLLFYGWQRYQWIQYGYRIETAQKKMEGMAESNRQLRVERASLRNPQRVDSIARERLGMVVPAPGQLVTLGGRVVPNPPQAREPVAREKR